MPKKKKGHKKKNYTKTSIARPLLEKENGQEYALVTKLTGGMRLIAYAYDNTERKCKIRGNMKKGRHKCYINVGDTILIAYRDYSDKWCDVIHKYTPEEVKILKKMGELNDLRSMKGKEEEEEIGFVIGDIEIEEEDIGIDFSDI